MEKDIEPSIEFKEVSKEVFDAFINTYPRKLEWNITNISEPPLGTWNDFADGKKWPESIVAQVKLYDESAYHFFKKPQYFVPGR